MIRLRCLRLLSLFLTGIYLTTFLVTSVVTDEIPHYNCTSLTLDCSDRPDHVATGFIYGGRGASRPSRRSKRSRRRKSKRGLCLAPDPEKDCQAHPLNGRVFQTMQNCLWREPNCIFNADRVILGHPCFPQTANYLMAKEFKCVHQSRIIRFCSDTSRQMLKLTAEHSEAYLLPHEYPSTYSHSHNCSLIVGTEIGNGRIRFQSLFMHMHPRRGRTPESPCEFDYLQFAPESGSGDEVKYFCGIDPIDYTANAMTRVRFVSGPDLKHHGGFVIRVSADGFVPDENEKEQESETIDVDASAGSEGKDDSSRRKNKTKGNRRKKL